MFNPFLVPAGLLGLLVSCHCEFPVLLYSALKENIQKKDVKKDGVACPFPPPLHSRQRFRERRRRWGLRRGIALRDVPPAEG